MPRATAMLSCMLTAGVGLAFLPATKPARQQASLRCLLPDSLKGTGGLLRYGAFTKDSVTQDLEGMELAFSVKGDRWTGTIQEAVGELGQPRPLIGVIFTATGRNISFKYLNGQDTASFSGRVSCDSISGTWRPYPKVSLVRGLPRTRRPAPR